ncbi:MAG: tetratricopeptide repeat protein [Planctomycetota bacterium]|nr:tetratricopeptide repeat protein [Planctomycetota bacterium]
MPVRVHLLDWPFQIRSLFTNLSRASGMTIVCCVIAFFFTNYAIASDPAVVIKSAPLGVSQLIKQLGHPRYVLREQAQTELMKIGPPALDALSGALLSDDIEIAMRARYLLTAIKIDWVQDQDPKHIRAAMKDYDQKSDAQRKEIIDELSKQTGDPERVALARIVRYEKSTLLSKLAALGILESVLNHPSSDARHSTIGQQLNESQRPAAEWLQDNLAKEIQIDQKIDYWKRIADRELEIWKGNNDQTSHEIVQRILFHLVQLLDQAGRDSEAEPFLLQVVALQPGDEESVRLLVQKMIGERTEENQLKKRAARVIKNIGEKFNEIFATDPLLLYVLAHAEQTLGADDAANKIADQAQNLNPTTAAKHLVTASTLERQGWFDWSENEYRKVIQIDGLKSIYTHMAISQLSEMLHGQGADKKAAEALEPLVLLLKSSPNVKNQFVQQIKRSPASIYSRMHFFRACHFEREGERAEQKIELLKAVEEDPSDADVLIAIYRLPNQTVEENSKTIDRIETAIDSFREQIRKTPNSAMALNQFAWLVGNTLGEENLQLAEEAIRNSHRSLEIKPDAAGYLDTLGRCYYAKGDLEKAVRFQREAAQLDPHSGLIREQLELFEAAKEKNQRKDAS